MLMEHWSKTCLYSWPRSVLSLSKSHAWANLTLNSTDSRQTIMRPLKAALSKKNHARQVYGGISTYWDLPISVRQLGICASLQKHVYTHLVDEWQEGIGDKLGQAHRSLDMPSKPVTMWLLLTHVGHIWGTFKRIILGDLFLHSAQVKMIPATRPFDWHCDTCKLCSVSQFEMVFGHHSRSDQKYVYGDHL